MYGQLDIVVLNIGWCEPNQPSWPWNFNLPRWNLVWHKNKSHGKRQPFFGLPSTKWLWSMSGEGRSPRDWERELSYTIVPIILQHKNLTLYRCVAGSSQMTLSGLLWIFKADSSVKSTKNKIKAIPKMHIVSRFASWLNENLHSYVIIPSSSKRLITIVPTAWMWQ